jgi:hypothetical protein
MNLKKLFLFVILSLFLINNINATQIMHCQLPAEDIMLNFDGVNSVYYNPANLGAMSQKELKVTHISYIADINIESIAFGCPIDKYSGYGMALSYMSMEMEYNRDGYKGIKSERYLSGRGMYGYNIGYGKFIGTGLKFELDVSESSYKLPPFLATDIGFSFNRFLLSDITLGIFVENLISCSSEISIGRKLSVYTGILYHWNKWLSSSVGYQCTRYVPDIFSVGLQFDFFDLLSMNIVHKYKDDSIENFFSNVYMGMIINYYKVFIEYGINPIIGFREIIHKFSVKFVF